MSDSALGTAAMWSYGLAAAGFFAFAIRLALGWQGSIRGTLLLAVSIASALWAASTVAYVQWPSHASWWLSIALDACRYGLWFAFVFFVLRGAQQDSGGAGARAPTLPWSFMVIVAA